MLRKKMKSAAICILIYSVLSVSAVAGDKTVRESSEPAIRRVTTALDHLSVLEFDEPVTMAAAGSPAFQIERQENKVFIKPSKPGITTNLFVWTASKQRFSYELVVGDAGSMTASIHEVRPAPAEAPDKASQFETLADALLTHTILESQPIEGKGIKPSRTSRVELRVEQVFSTAQIIYIQYTLENFGDHPYRIGAPTVIELALRHPHLNPLSVRGRQVDSKLLDSLGGAQEVPRTVAHYENESTDVAPTTRQRGLVAVERSRQDKPEAIVLQLAFDSEVKATFVF